MLADARPAVQRSSGTHNLRQPLPERRRDDAAISRFCAFQSTLDDRIPVEYDDDMTIPDDQVERLDQADNFFN